MLKVGQQSRFGPPTCTISGLERQFDKWHAPTGSGVGAPKLVLPQTVRSARSTLGQGVGTNLDQVGPTWPSWLSFCRVFAFFLVWLKGAFVKKGALGALSCPFGHPKPCKKNMWCYLHSFLKAMAAVHTLGGRIH